MRAHACLQHTPAHARAIHEDLADALVLCDKDGLVRGQQTHSHAHTHTHTDSRTHI